MTARRADWSFGVAVTGQICTAGLAKSGPADPSQPVEVAIYVQFMARWRLCVTTGPDSYLSSSPQLLSSLPFT
jgi:hypothetical protein